MQTIDGVTPAAVIGQIATAFWTSQRCEGHRHFPSIVEVALFSHRTEKLRKIFSPAVTTVVRCTGDGLPLMLDLLTELRC